MSQTVSSENRTNNVHELELTRCTFDVAAEAMFTVAANGQILDANATACERLEYSRDELLKMTVADIDPVHDPEVWRKHFEELRHVQKMTLETKHKSKSGIVTDVEVSVAYFQFEDREYCCSSVRDITQRKRSQQILRLQHDILAKIASTSGLLSNTLQEICRIVEEMVPNSIATIMRIDPNDGCLRLVAGHNLSAGMRAAFDRLQPGEFAGSCGSAAFFKKPVIVEDTRSSQHWKQMQVIVERFGLLACWSLPILDERDEVLGTFAISHHSTGKPSPYHLQILETASHLASIAIRRQRFEEQLRLAHEELAHISRLNMMGEMASSFAHELNQPLAAIVNYAFALEHSVASALNPEAVRTQVQSIREQALRAGAIVSSVRSMAKRSTPARRPVVLNELVQKSVTMLEPELHQMGVVLTADFAATLPEIHVDEIQIQQILVNLVRNAMEAMSVQPAENRFLKISTSVESETRVVLRIVDSGPGLLTEKSEEVFEPFRTSKPDGMGMGLTICRSIAERHGGQLVARNIDGLGAEFSLTLPVNDEMQS